jgi:hypothetical protein
LDGSGPARGAPGSAPPRRGGAPVGLIAGGVALVAAVGGLAWFAFRPRPAAPVPSPATVTVAPAPAIAPTVVPPLPALSESDATVRERLSRLSPHPVLAAWLQAADVIRRTAAVVDNVAQGESPRPHLGFLWPREPLQVVTRGGRTFVAPRSYAPYDGVGELAAAVDAGAAAAAYRELEPLFDAAWRELGYADAPFRRGLGRSLDQLLAVPVPADEIEVKPVMRARLVYEYADRRLETLTPAQKLFLRMGPKNARAVQATLRDLQAALRP